MQVWAIANQKGGVGKTTTAVSLAGYFSQQGANTLIIDMDPHGSMTSYFGADPDDIDSSVYELFQRNHDQVSVPLASVLMKTRFPKLYLLPASTALATLDRQIGAQAGMGLVIRRTLEHCSTRFQHVLLDCPPMMGLLMVNALAACQHLIIPVQTEFLALKGLDRMVRTIDMMNHARPNVLRSTILPTMYDRRTRASLQALDQLRASYGDRVWSDVIPVDTQFREASRAGAPLTIMRPRSRGAVAYRAFAAAMNEETGDGRAKSVVWQPDRQQVPV